MKQAIQKQEGAFRTKCNHNREECKEYASVKKRQTSNHLKKAAQSKGTRIVHQRKIEKEERQIEELQEDLEMVEATMCRRFTGVLCHPPSRKLRTWQSISACCVVWRGK